MDYKFNGSEGKPIPKETAKKWLENYVRLNPDEVKAHFFGREIILQILDEQSCVGIRIYYGIDDSGKKQLMLVGSDSNGNNLLPSVPGERNENIIADVSFPCPTYCPPNGDF